MYLEKLLVHNAFIKLHAHAQTVPTFCVVTAVVIPGKLLEQIPSLRAQLSLSQYSTSCFHGKDATLQGLSEQPPTSVNNLNSCAATTHRSRARPLHHSLLLRQLSPVPPTGRFCLCQQKIPY